MIDLQTLYSIVDQLPRQELEELNHYIQQRRMTNVWEVSIASITAIEELLKPLHDLTSHMSEQEINIVLDEALHEVRDERKTQGGS